MEWVPPEEYFKNIPKKWAGSAALFFNSENNILLVKPTYRDHWLPVGGSIDMEESPLQAVRREVKEEIGIDLINPTLLCVQYYHAEDKIKGDRFQFLFDGGVLNGEQIASIKLPPGELSEYRFFSLDGALQVLGRTNRERVKAGVEARRKGTIIYLES